MGKRILVTGASRGIGEATARLLAKKGYDLFLVCSSSFDALEKIREEIVAENDIDCRIMQCNVGDKDDVLKMTTAVKDLSDLYGIVNNAAISIVGLMTDVSFDDWTRIVNVNLNSVFYICHELVPYLVNQKSGRIVNVSSIWGNVGASCEVAYSATKGGVNSFTKALAKELGPSNIQVNAVAFGVINTSMNACFSLEEMEELKNEIPADRIAEPDEAAQMILNVLETPRYLTGQIITMDGGYI